MNCEICKIIESHGLDRSVHDWWHCADVEEQSPACRRPVRQPVRSLLRTCRRQLTIHWRRLLIVSSRRDAGISKPQAIGRELKLLTYALASQIGAQVK